MKKLIVLATALIVSSATYAANGERHVYTEGYQSKAQAYDAGFDVLEEYQSMTDYKLGSKLMISDASIANLTGGSVMVEEFATNRNVIQYRAIVELDYQYESNDDD